MNNSDSKILNEIRFLREQISLIIDKPLEMHSENLSVSALSSYTGYKPPYIYKLTSTGVIPHYKPRNGKLLFKKSEIDEWLYQNRVASNTEIEKQAEHFLSNEGGC